jgi:hypothetical protein
MHFYFIHKTILSFLYFVYKTVRALFWNNHLSPIFSFSHILLYLSPCIFLKINEICALKYPLWIKEKEHWKRKSYL